MGIHRYRVESEELGLGQRDERVGHAVALGLLVLLVAPAGQRPISYARAAAEYYLSSNTYHNRRTRPADETPVVQDVVGVREDGLDIETIEAEQQTD